MTGLPPHSVYCVVEGGADTDILNTIWLKKTAGTTTYDTTSGSVNDSMGNPHTLKFSRPTDVNVYVVVNLHTRSGWPTDGVQRIKDAITVWALLDSSTELEAVLQKVAQQADIDLAEGVNLDMIGEIVDISRIIPASVLFAFFGFEDNPAAMIFGEDGSQGIGARFYDEGEPYLAISARSTGC